MEQGWGKGMCSLKYLIQCIEEQAARAQFLSPLAGGNERWLQGQILCSLGKMFNLTTNESLFQEQSFDPDARQTVDIVFCIDPRQRNRIWNLVELKMPAKSTQLGDVIADITRLWPNPRPKLKDYTASGTGVSFNLKGGTGFVAILIDDRRFSPELVLGEILGGFSEKDGITRASVEQKLKVKSKISDNLFLLIFEMQY